MSKHLLKQFIEITIGVLFMSMAFHFFFLPMDLVTGGVTGISIILQDIITPALFIFIANIVLLLIGLAFLGTKFFMKTIYGTIMLPLAISLLEISPIPHDYFISQITTSDTSKLIISIICGGGLAACGLGLCFRNDATTGGVDVIQKIISKYFKIPYSKAVYITDGIIVMCAFIEFRFEKTFYAILCILYIGIIVDIISTGGRFRRTAYIITKKPEIVKNAIFEHINRGVTECDVRGGYSSEEYVMLICTLSKSESYSLKFIIEEVDEHAFTFYSDTKEVIGAGF